MTTVQHILQGIMLVLLLVLGAICVLNVYINTVGRDWKRLAVSIFGVAWIGFLMFNIGRNLI